MFGGIGAGSVPRTNAGLVTNRPSRRKPDLGWFGWYMPLVETDRELLRRWQGGDRGAGDALVRRHFSSIFRFFRSKLGDDVQDLVQRTFLDCVAATDTIDETIGVRPFLFAIAHRRLIDELRRRGRRPQLDPARESLMEIGLTPSGVLAQQQEVELLQRALPRLPLEQQVTLELFYWEGMRGREVAAVLEVSEHTVRSRLARAKAALKEELERLASSPALAASTHQGLESWAAEAGKLALPNED